jgi:putative transposase
MPRRKRVLQSDFPYHVTLRSHNKVMFEMDISKLWLFSCDLLLFCTYAFKLEIHSFVLMNNHYHMLIRTPEANLDKFMNYFNRELSREMTYKTGSINQKFGARYHSSIVSELRYYSNVYKYVYRNPVEANLCSDVQDYPYSSLNFLLGRDTYRFPIFDTYFELLEDHWPTLYWLNTSYADLELKKIKSGFKKAHFIL